MIWWGNCFGFFLVWRKGGDSNVIPWGLDHQTPKSSGNSSVSCTWNFAPGMGWLRLQHSSPEPADGDSFPEPSGEEAIPGRADFNVISPGNSIRLSFPMSGRNCWVPEPLQQLWAGIQMQLWGGKIHRFGNWGANNSSSQESSSSSLFAHSQGDEPLPTSLTNPALKGHKSRVFSSGRSCPIGIPGIFTGKPGREQEISQNSARKRC